MESGGAGSAVGLISHLQTIFQILDAALLVGGQLQQGVVGRAPFANVSDFGVVLALGDWVIGSLLAFGGSIVVDDQEVSVFAQIAPVLIEGVLVAVEKKSGAH